MKKLAIPFVVGITMGLGASTGAAVLLGREPATLEESLAEAMDHGEGTDSVAGAEHADSTAHGDVALAADSVHADEGHGLDPHADESSNPAAEAGSVAHNGVPAIPSTSVGGFGSPNADARAMTKAELAKLFATMSAREAARVLQHMEDQEVQVILGELGNREAAAILSNITPERAATISRTILRGERSSQ